MSDLNALPIVEFSLDEQRYALPIHYVKRITRLVEISPLPNDQPDVMGVINLQGQIIPVIDIRKKLGLPNSDLKIQDFLVVTETAKTAFAFVASSVNFQEFQAEAVTKADTVIKGIKFVDKIIKDTTGVIHLLNVDQIIPQEELNLCSKSVDQK